MSSSQAGDRLTSSFPAWKGPHLHLTWPLLALSGSGPSPRHRSKQSVRQRPMLPSSHLNTAATCAVQGIKFIPMVAETTGAWDRGADRILRLFASAAAAREGVDGAALTGLMFQELSVCIRGFRARAALRRRAELQTGAQAEPAVRSAAVVLEPPAL